MPLHIIIVGYRDPSATMPPYYGGGGGGGSGWYPPGSRVIFWL